MSALNAERTARGARRRMLRRGFGPVPARVAGVLQRRGFAVLCRETSVVTKAAPLGSEQQSGFGVVPMLSTDFWTARWVSDLVDTFAWSISYETLADALVVLRGDPAKRAALATTLDIMREASSPSWARAESTLTAAERRTLRRWCGHDEELKASLAAARRIVDAMADDFSDLTAHLDHWIETLRDLCWSYAHRGEVAVWPREEGKPFTASRNHAWNEDS